MMISKHAVIAMVAGSITLLYGSVASAEEASTTTTAVSTAVSTAADTGETAVREHLSKLAAAASAGEAEKMALLWATDGSYIDETGSDFRGRQAIQKRFADVLPRGGKNSLVMNASTVKTIGPDIAWVEGTVSKQTNVGVEPSTRFTMLLQKQGGEWVISSATETAITNRTVADHLNALNWLVGDWSAGSGSSKVNMTADWMGNKSFIFCKFTTDMPGAKPKVDAQLIGWDPTKQQIVSWHFDSSGGFGYGNWNKQGKQWMIQAAGVEQSGSQTAATNIMAVEDNNKFTWQSVGRNVDGARVPDTEPLIVQRVVK